MTGHATLELPEFERLPQPNFGNRYEPAQADERDFVHESHNASGMWRAKARAQRTTGAGRVSVVAALKRQWIVSLQRLRLIWPKFWKRSLDIAGATLGLLLFAPLMLLIAVLVKGTDGGPIFYFSARVGRDGRPYSMPKFRSMFVGAKSLWHSLKEQGNDLGPSVTFKRRSDPRVTWIGRIIRKTSLDELPQFWSVLKGDMSLVGPRPTLEEEFPIYRSYARQRLVMKPGITCTWQVAGRGDIPFDQQLEMDLDYYHHLSPMQDLKLLALTIPAVISAKGAY